MLPPARVREILQAARRASVPFGQAWPAALAAVTDERWAETVAQTAATWRRCYELEPPTRRDIAVDTLSRGLAGELADLDALGRCPVCDGRVVQHPRARVPRVYCSETCRKIASARRERLDVAA
jgi:hypothetical protein